MAAYLSRSELARKVTLISVLLLLLSIAIDTLVAPTGGRAANPVVWAALSLPLLILLPGIWRGGLSSCVWLGFASMLYFAQAVVALFSPHWRALDILQLLFSIALFIGALLFVRWRARALRAAAIS